MDFRSLLTGLPETVQYIAVLALVMVILYVSLMLTRLIGQNHGEKVDYNDHEKADKAVPDLFASTAFKRKPKNTASGEAQESKDN